MRYYHVIDGHEIDIVTNSSSEIENGFALWRSKGWQDSFPCFLKYCRSKDTEKKILFDQENHFSHSIKAMYSRRTVRSFSKKENKASIKTIEHSFMDALASLQEHSQLPFKIILFSYDFYDHDAGIYEFSKNKLNLLSLGVFADKMAKSNYGLRSSLSAKGTILITANLHDIDYDNNDLWMFDLWVWSALFVSFLAYKLEEIGFKCVMTPAILENELPDLNSLFDDVIWPVYTISFGHE